MEKIEHFHSEVIQQYISSLRKHIQEEYTIDPKMPAPELGANNGEYFG